MTSGWSGVRVLALAAACSALGLAGCGLQQDLSQGSGVGGGATAPATPIIAATLAGTTFDWSATRGHVVVLDFWASWCSPCRAEQAELNRLRTEYAPKGVVFLGVDVRDDNVDGSAYERDLKVLYPSVNDAAEVIASEYNVAAPPTVIIVDSHGNIVDRLLGTTTGVSADLSRLTS
jgi:thiol-disulfide isomerase/thioredoxin